jgi:hypothetical protein
MRNRIITLVLGLVVLLGGMYLFLQTDVRCAGISMHPGDSCEHTNHGRTSTLSYDQERSQDQRKDIIYMIGGALITAAGAGLMLKDRIDRRRPAPSSAVFIGGPAQPTTTSDQIVSGER